MILNSVSEESQDRIRQALHQLSIIETMEGMGPTVSDENIKVQKGLIFVSMYAAIEYTLTACVSAFLSEIQNERKNQNEYKKYILCASLHAEFNALTDGGVRNSWSKRVRFMDKLKSTDPAFFDATIFPSDGTNISYDQIEMVWKILHLPDPILPDEVHDWMLKELKDHRNAIAHGRETAAAIGSRFTFSVLKSRLREVEVLCGHLVHSFESHLINKGYLES